MSTSATGNGRPKPSSFLRRVRIRNYKSIAHCDVELGPLTILVGRNGSGKSNFLDALRFVGGALRTSPAESLRGRRSYLSAKFFLPIVIELQVDFGVERRAVYHFEVGDSPQSPLKVLVLSERLVIEGTDGVVGSFEVKNGTLISSTEGSMPPVAHDRLYLANAASLPMFRPVYDALLAMRFYDLDPKSMRSTEKPSADEALEFDGWNIASLIGRLETEEPDLKERIKEYLAIIVPGISDFRRVDLGPVETIKFFQTVSGSNLPVEFFADSMSHGTLRTLGTLVAVVQLAMEPPSVRLVAIEEPETSLHPAAAAALMDAMQEAAVDGQVIVTTHSPDLMDRVDFDSDRLLIVQMRDGETVIGPIDSASREIISEHLCTPGELLRQDMIEPDRTELDRPHPITMSESAMVPE